MICKQFQKAQTVVSTRRLKLKINEQPYNIDQQAYTIPQAQLTAQSTKFKIS